MKKIYIVRKEDIKKCIKIPKIKMNKLGFLFYIVEIDTKTPSITIDIRASIFCDELSPINNNKSKFIQFFVGNGLCYPKWKVWIREFRREHKLMFSTTKQSMKQEVIGLTGVMCVLNKDCEMYKEFDTKRNFYDSVVKGEHFSLFNQWIHEHHLIGFHPSDYLYKTGQKEKANKLDELWLKKYCRAKNKRELMKNRKKFYNDLDKALLKIVKIKHS